MFSQQDNWCFKECHSIKLGDKRWDRRFLSVASCFLAYPTKPIHGACDTWSNTERTWEALEYYFTRRKKPPSKAPLVREAIRKIAKLGGVLGRKSDKEPGMTYIWRGWEKLVLISEFYSMNPSEMTYGQLSDLKDWQLPIFCGCPW